MDRFEPYRGELPKEMRRRRPTLLPRNANRPGWRLGGFLALWIVAAGCSGQDREQPPPNKYEGFHDESNCERIVGWAWDANHPDDRIKVDLYDGDALLTTVTADHLRQGLVKNGVGDGKHEFIVPLPASLKDGRTHTITVRFGGTATNLSRTPQNVTCGADAAPQKGAGGSEKAAR